MAITNIATLAVDVVINARRARAQLANVQATAGATATSVRNMSLAIGSVGLAASGILLVRKAFNELFDGIKAATDAAVKIEGHISNIELIAASGNLGAIGESFFNVSDAVKSAQFDEIENAMVFVARSGVRGADALEQMAIESLRLSKTSLDITASEAAEGLGAMIGNLKLSSDEVNNLASAVNVVSDNVRSTSGEILKTSARLSGFADAFNISASEIIGLSGALLSTRATATTVRSTLGAIFRQLASDPIKAGTAVKLFGKDLENFNVQLKTDFTGAIFTFLQAFKELDTKDQEEALKNLGLASQRTGAVVKLAEVNIDDLRAKVELAGKAFREGTANTEKNFKELQKSEARLIATGKQWERFKSTLIEADSVINLLSGSVLTLNRSLKGNANEIKLDFGEAPENISDINQKLIELRNQIKESREEATSLREVFSEALPGFIFGGAIGGEISTLLGQLEATGAEDRIRGIKEALEELRETRIDEQKVVSFEDNIENFTKLEDQLQRVEDFINETGNKRIEIFDIDIVNETVKDIDKLAEELGLLTAEQINLDKSIQGYILKLKDAETPVNRQRQIEIEIGQLLLEKINLQQKVIEQLKEEEGQRQKVAEAEDKIKREFREKEIGDIFKAFGEGLPFEAFIIEPLEKDLFVIDDRLKKVVEQFDELVKKFGFAPPEIEKLVDEFKGLSKAARERAFEEDADRVRKAAERRLKDIDSFTGKVTDLTGPFDSLFSTLDRFEGVLDDPLFEDIFPDDFGDSIRSVMDLSLKSLGEVEKITSVRTSDFARRFALDAGKSETERALLEAQKELAIKMLTALRDAPDDRKKMIELLEKINKKELTLK